MPNTAHRLTESGEPEEVPIAELEKTGESSYLNQVIGLVRAAQASRSRTQNLADVIREESREAIDTLHGLGIDVVMLTGDNERVAHWVAEELGVDRVIAEVLPDEKSDVIEELQSEGRLVAMTGDGVNDAPALATADVGIAIGAGTDVAVETADVVLVESDPRDAVDVIRLAQATYRKMVQNLWWATGYNVVAIPLAAGVLATAGILLSPAVGAVLMSLSTVIVAVNARYLTLD